MHENNVLGDCGQLAGLLTVEPTGDKMPYGTRQKATEEPDNQGFQHNQSFLDRASDYANAKNPIGKPMGLRKTHRLRFAEMGYLYLLPRCQMERFAQCIALHGCRIFCVKLIQHFGQAYEKMALVSVSAGRSLKFSRHVGKKLSR